MDIRDYCLSVDQYNRPKVVKDNDAIALLITRLFLLNPGENELDPEMGIGIFSNYRFSMMDDLSTLEARAQAQIDKYLPIFQSLTVNIKQSETNRKEIVITIIADNTVFSFDTKDGQLKLSDLMKGEA